MTVETVSVATKTIDGLTLITRIVYIESQRESERPFLLAQEGAGIDDSALASGRSRYGHSGYAMP